MKTRFNNIQAQTVQHGIHHIRERGYVEAPVRIRSISTALRASGWCDFVPPEEYALKHILAVHHRGLVAYLRRACQDVPEGKSLYPYVFPIRNATRPPRERSVLAGYYCIDTFPPVHRHAFQAARRAVECSLTAADEILRGRRFAYALVRPPGHHAESRVFGGFCYFNNAAVAAQYLIKFGRVAILDVDYHHGNGQQAIFYDRSDVLTISIHGDPAFAYPYFAGFADEKGRGEGEGFNLNITLPIKRIATFKPDFLIVSLGLDTAKGDPTGTWHLRPKDFDANGRMLAELRLPTLVIQEGGYRTRTLGTNARSFFQGLLGVPRASGTGRPGQ